MPHKCCRVREIELDVFTDTRYGAAGFPPNSVMGEGFFIMLRVFPSPIYINFREDAKTKRYLIQIPWNYILDPDNPFRHRIFFAVASDSCGAPVLLCWYGQVVENSV